MARFDTVGKHETQIIRTNSSIAVKYHQTKVVEFTPSSITLRNNGWSTSTTKLRMNQASNQFGLGFSVYQENWDWFVVYKGQTLDFYDGMELSRA